MTKTLLRAIVATAAMLALSAAPAFAYRELVGSTDPGATQSYECPACHSLEDGETSPTVGPRSVPATWTFDSEAGTNVGTRKGPHGGYTSGTQMCQSCHTAHDASGLGAALLPEPTTEATCFSCHDGTGGGGVYGVIAQRTGVDPAETTNASETDTRGGVHRVGWLNPLTGTVTVPTGSGEVEATFTGASGAMTCTDCHSPHNSNTVAPFVGDRRRSTDDTATASTIATNRLLRKRPTGGSVDVDVYGSGWCLSCHEGADGPGHHVVESDDANRNYSAVRRLAALDSSAAAAGTGDLGGSNLGYLMPDRQPFVPGAGHGGEVPICQQCHEDARVLGGVPDLADTQFNVTFAQRFVAPVDGSAAGNPTFQNFPHETTIDTMTIEEATRTATPGGGLCYNCHTP